MRELEKNVIDLYNKGMNTVQIGKKLQINNSTAGRILKKHGLKRRYNNLVFSPREIEEMINQYLDGSTTEEIAKRCNVSPNTISSMLKKNGIKLRRAIRRTKLKNQNYFDQIDTAEKAYWLGFMLSDGSIVKDNRTHESNRTPSFGIMLKGEDKYILEEFDKQLGSDGSSIKISSRNECYLRYSSNQICNSLAQYGVVPNKTFTVELPKISKKLMPHLIRGIFDGDGTVFHTKIPYKNGLPVIIFGFYGTQLLCEQLMDYLHSEIGITKKKITNKGTVSFWTLRRPRDVAAFYHYIYDNSTVHLKRKKQKFDDGLQDVNTEVTSRPLVP